MLVTGQPLVVSGMVTAPPDPVYLMMVIAPLLVVKVNCACTAAVSAKSSSSGSSLEAQAVPNRQAGVLGHVVLARTVFVFIRFLAKGCLEYVLCLTQWLCMVKLAAQNGALPRIAPGTPASSTARW
jgi:hypothetical protein